MKEELEYLKEKLDKTTKQLPKWVTQEDVKGVLYKESVILGNIIDFIEEINDVVETFK